MKLISTTKAILQVDRNGLFEEYVEIDIRYTPESESKRYRFDVDDFAILNKDTENETKMIIHDRNGSPVKRTYYKSYEEFDQTVEYLKTVLPSELVGSELIDYLVLNDSLMQLESDPIYDVQFQIKNT